MLVPQQDTYFWGTSNLMQMLLVYHFDGIYQEYGDFLGPCYFARDELPQK